MNKMKLLLTNDDGFHATGLQTLYQVLKEQHDVTIVAPDRERSAVGHGITMYYPLRTNGVELDTKTHWIVDGTPADCVKLAIEKLLVDEVPDLIISGINHGSNLGSDILYSGTVSAAIEASVYHIPSLATSLTTDYGLGNADFMSAARFIALRLEKLWSLAQHSILNLNFPANGLDNTKVCFTKLGRLFYENAFDERKDPRGKSYYWMAGSPAKLEQEPDSDVLAITSGNISITPLKIDLTDYQFLQGDLCKKF